MTVFICSMIWFLISSGVTLCSYDSDTPPPVPEKLFFFVWPVVMLLLGFGVLVEYLRVRFT